MKENHIKYVRIVFQKIRKANLKLKLTKCKQFKQKLIFVRHRIIARNIEFDPKNIKKIKNAKVLNLIMKLKEFLYTIQFYKQFVKDYIDIAELIYNMLKDDIPEYQDKD